jgi:hypothetical protein
VSSVYDNYKNQLINNNQRLCGKFLREDAVGLVVNLIDLHELYLFIRNLLVTRIDQIENRE